MNFTHQRPFCGRVVGFPRVSQNPFPGTLPALFSAGLSSLWARGQTTEEGGPEEVPREGAPASSSTGDPAPGQQHRRPTCEVGFTSLMDPLFPFSWGSRGGIWRPARKGGQGWVLVPSWPPVQMGACSRSPMSCVQPAGCNQVEGLPLPVFSHHATPSLGCVTSNIESKGKVKPAFCVRLLHTGISTLLAPSLPPSAH